MPATGADSEYDSGPQFLRDVWALSAIAILVVILRIFAKFRIAKSGWDDVLMALALVSNPFFHLSNLFPIMLQWISIVYTCPRAEINHSLLHSFWQ